MKIDNMTIIDKIREVKSKFPNKTAIIDLKNNTEATFSQIDTQSEAVYNYLKKNNFSKGDKVVLFVPISLKFYIILIGILKMGMQIVFIDPYAKINHINKCCEMISPNAIIGSKKVLFLGNFLKEIRKIPIKIDYKNILKDSKYHEIEISDDYEISKDTPALISFTSGSTGFPKIIMRTHGFLLGQHNVLDKNIQFSENTQAYSSFPMFLLSHICTGTTTLIPDINFGKPIKTDVKSVVKQIESKNIENIILPPSILENIVRFSKKNNIKLDCVQRVFTGGAPVFPKLMYNLLEIFPKSKVRALYGASEVEPISIFNFETITKKQIESMKNGAGLFVGKKVDQIDLKIERLELEENLKLNEKNLKKYSKSDFEKIQQILKKSAGEILVKGENVLKNYLNVKSDPNKEWHETGDMGYINENNELFLLGRAKGRVKIKNSIYYPLSIETAFSFCKEVKKCALISKNEELYMIIEKEDDYTRTILENKEIKKLCEKFNISQVIEKKIPLDKRHNSKIDYNKLEKLIEKL